MKLIKEIDWFKLILAICAIVFSLSFAYDVFKHHPTDIEGDLSVWLRDSGRSGLDLDLGL